MYEPVWTEAELRSALDQYEDELRQAGKARNTIATYVQHPERFINWLVGHYQPATRPTQPRAVSASKYEPLRAHLASRSEPVVEMTFQEIEEILGASLPASARKYRPWWANESAGTHIHARAWLDAGRRASRIDMDSETVQFIH